MKGEKFILKDSESTHFNKLCTVVTEPYPTIESSYGSPARSGLVTSNVYGNTCVSVVTEDGVYLHNTPVSLLERTYTLYDLFKIYNYSSRNVDSLYSSVECILKFDKYLDYIEKHNHEVDKIYNSIQSSKPTSYDNLNDKLLSFYLECCYGVSSWIEQEENFYGTPIYVIKMEYALPLPITKDNVYTLFEPEYLRHWVYEWKSSWRIPPLFKLSVKDNLYYTIKSCKEFTDGCQFNTPLPENVEQNIRLLLNFYKEFFDTLC